ncbi:helix-turn-helix transcriptional regulator [Hyphomicrobium sp.]|uniref:helix-turn-helix transcriptional regulator n=1 Tax=Hyphomicrobium sp. TaxID=82 RepID=UPI001D3472CE|nr:helix-turn-helix transcriptional regulator [Hyphomicrobium sp.]MBY0559376.1 helix-turn-helix transcriptional regulator [Hyphomicrobium sp.]
MSQTDTRESALGAFLRDRRTKLDPASFGLPLTRRRTPGLRREEVAQRANVSATWYTWLEQGRGGAPSADVLDRIARALMLTGAEREHLFVLGLGRLPEVRLQADDSVTPRLQRLVDAFEYSPAIVKNATWDVIAWNRAFATVMTDYGALPPERRNVLRVFFGNPHVRAAQFDWESVARFVVGVFRADVARVGASAKVAALVDDLSRQSPDFDRLWRSNDVLSHGGGLKQLRHPVLGTVNLEFSAFAVDGRPDLGLVVYNPATEDDRERIKALIASSAEAATLRGVASPAT